MLREVQIRDSALLPKVQFNIGEGGGGDEQPHIFMTDLALIRRCKLG